MKEQSVLGFPLVRCDRKTVGITVKAGGAVQVRAPRRMPYADIVLAVQSKAEWIAKATEKMSAVRPEPTKEQQESLRAYAKELMPLLVARWSEKTGLVPTSVKITSARRRYGSCSGKGGLCFSLFLMQSPLPAIEYVVLHELCHLRRHDHSRAFWALVEKYMPDYRERKNMLV